MEQRCPSPHPAAMTVLAFLIGAAMLSGCFSTSLYHADGRVFDPEIQMSFPNSAWVAVDSCSRGVHAIVELELDADIRPPSTDNLAFAPGAEQLSPVHPMDVRLIYDRGLLASFEKDRLEGPICYRQPPGFGDDRGRQDHETRCVYTYRAEFSLDRVPKDPSQFVVRYGDQPVYLARRD